MQNAKMNSHVIGFFQFVTRAVRVIDLITNLDMAAFQTHSGLTAFINRLEVGLSSFSRS